MCGLLISTFCSAEFGICNSSIDLLPINLILSHVILYQHHDFYNLLISSPRVVAKKMVCQLEAIQLAHKRGCFCLLCRHSWWWGRVTATVTVRNVTISLCHACWLRNSWFIKCTIFPDHTCFCSNGWINYVSWTTSLFTRLSEEGLLTERSENPSRLKTKLKSGIQEWNEQSNRFRITKNWLDSGTRFTSEVQEFTTEMRTSILMDHLRHEPTSWDVDMSFCGPSTTV